MSFPNRKFKIVINKKKKNLNHFAQNMGFGIIIFVYYLKTFNFHKKHTQAKKIGIVKTRKNVEF